MSRIRWRRPVCGKWRRAPWTTKSRSTGRAFLSGISKLPTPAQCSADLSADTPGRFFRLRWDTEIRLPPRGRESYHNLARMQLVRAPKPQNRDPAATGPPSVRRPHDCPPIELERSHAANSTSYKHTSLVARRVFRQQLAAAIDCDACRSASSSTRFFARVC
jgi:hypothetical protein